jgi:hypothetical protein
MIMGNPRLRRPTRRALRGGALAVGGVALLAGCNLGVPAARYPITTAGAAVDALAGDIDGDGDTDAVGLANDGYAVGLNDGTGELTVTRYPTTVSYVDGALGDVNGDGRPDLLRPSANNVETRLGTGTRFANERTVASATESVTSAPVLSDRDDDGDLDLAAGTSGGVALWANDGTGTFGPVRLVDTPYAVYDLGVADVNFDGRDDLVVGLASGYYPDYEGRVGVIMALPAGGYADAAIYAPGLPGAYGGTYITLGDIDDDEDLDLIATDGNTPYISVLRNDGSGVYGLPVLTPTGGHATEAVLADYDQDGIVDVATDTTVLFGEGTGAFSERRDVAGGFDVVGAELNGDTQPDLVYAGPTDLVVLVNALEGRRGSTIPVTGVGAEAIR